MAAGEDGQTKFNVGICFLKCIVEWTHLDTFEAQSYEHIKTLIVVESHEVSNIVFKFFRLF